MIENVGFVRNFGLIYCENSQHSSLMAGVSALVMSACLYVGMLARSFEAFEVSES